MFLHTVWEGRRDRKLQDIIYGVCVGQRHCVCVNPLRFFHGTKCPFSECFHPLSLFYHNIESLCLCSCSIHHTLHQQEASLKGDTGFILGLGETPTRKTIQNDLNFTTELQIINCKDPLLPVQRLYFFFYFPFVFLPSGCQLKN